MLAQILGGALMISGGGLMTASSLGFNRAARHWRSAAEFGDGLAQALADTISAPIPADEQALLDRLA